MSDPRLQFFAAAALVFLAACETVGDVVGQGYNVELSGIAEGGLPGDPDGRGIAEVSVVDRTDNLCYELTVFNIEPASVAHIHRGAAGMSGPPVVTLDAPTDGESTGCLRLESEIIDEIVANPAGFYINVHNAPFPQGAIRGQLRR